MGKKVLSHPLRLHVLPGLPGPAWRRTDETRTPSYPLPYGSPDTRYSRHRSLDPPTSVWTLLPTRESVCRTTRPLPLCRRGVGTRVDCVLGCTWTCVSVRRVSQGSVHTSVGRRGTDDSVWMGPVLRVKGGKFVDHDLSRGDPSGDGSEPRDKPKLAGGTPEGVLTPRVSDSGRSQRRLSRRHS